MSPHVSELSWESSSHSSLLCQHVMFSIPPQSYTKEQDEYVIRRVGILVRYISKVK